MLDANRLSVLIDFDVVSQDGEQVGEVDDFILNLTNTRIDYVIVDSATFLDIGGRKIAVPWKSFEVRVDDDGEIADGENVFVLKFAQDVFENAPDFDPDTFPAIGDDIADWDLYLNGYWDTAGTGAAGQATATPGDTATETPEASARPREEPGQPAGAV
jgi:sporulation protein YlmC with PRC-barrel domain